MIMKQILKVGWVLWYNGTNEKVLLNQIIHPNSGKNTYNVYQVADVELNEVCLIYGAKVVIADIHNELGHDTATQLGANASFISRNVTNESEIAIAVDFTVSKYGQLDIMYNNSRILCRTPMTKVDLGLHRFDQVMSVNVRGVLARIKHASRVMIPSESGSILCTASVTGILGGLAEHTYSVSMFAVIGIVKSLAAELSQHGGFKGSYCEPSDVANAAVHRALDDAK
uniref:Uncharacterized protein n=1 Tax=Tanacetum cinerariifolium TaxID=118510 RepID=A0A699HC84_TANCI|nr:hypothetical protein [Tanacetum cinerariifolium]